MIDLLIEEFEIISKKVDFNKFRNKTFLITGASGLIGSYLIYFLDYISQKYNLNICIYALSRRGSELRNRFAGHKSICMIIQDMNIPFKINFSCDYIIHAASNASPVAYATDPVGTMKTNLFGTMNLLDFACTQKAKFLYLSSGEIYGNNIDHHFTEDDFGSVDPKLSRSCYPESKRAAETLCISYHHQYGVYVDIARLCYVFGPTITNTNSRADAEFLRNAIKGQDIVLKSQGSQCRTWCYVADVVYALLIILLKEGKPDVYNVADESDILSIAQYAEILARIAGVGIRFEHPNSLEKQGYSQSANSILSGKKIKKMGWKPLFSLEKGLERTYQIKKAMEVGD